MDYLIQNSVLYREGKKWKQRWAVLKQATPKSSNSNTDCFICLFLYKDASHAKNGKEKYAIPLFDFCGINICKQYFKADNVLVIITSSQTAFLSFEQTRICDQWQHMIVEHFGEAVSYDISIPDNQKLKPGQASIRLYTSFFSIITNKNYKCLNRWYTNDICNYSAVDRSHFMFEIAPPSKSRGQLINLSVPNNADDIAKAFDYNTSLIRHGEAVLVQTDFHGSAMLDELGQARRNVGDQNFFQRAILRASNRMRKKRKEKCQNGNSKRKSASNCTGNNSMLEEAKFRSLDRKKSPDLSVKIDDSMLKTIQIVRSQSLQTDRTRQSPIEATPPPLPTKHTHHLSTSSEKADKKDENIAVKLRSMTTNDLPKLNHQMSIDDDRFNNSNSAETITMKTSKSDDKVKKDSYINGEVVDSIDKSALNVRKPKRSVDSLISNNYKNPAKHAIAKTKRAGFKGNSQKTPTPPPRSPVSLGIVEDTVFEFPSTEDLGEKVDRVSSNLNSSGLLREIDLEVKRRTVNSEDLSDEIFMGSSMPINNNNNINNNEPVYGNIPSKRIGSDSSTLLSVNAEVVRRRNGRRGSTKHLSDPLLLEAWSAATGDGPPASSLQELPTDYVNVKGTHSDDDDGSYVNVSSEDPRGKCKKNKPPSLRLKSYRNEFEKYDDDDSSIYHAVGALDDDTSHSTDSIQFSNQSVGSYENVNAVRSNPRKQSDYLNLMSPAKSKHSKPQTGLNYIMVGGRGNFVTKANSTSPVWLQPRSPADTYNKSDYTRIDEDATDAISRTMLEHKKQRDKMVTKTPTKTMK